VLHAGGNHQTLGLAAALCGMPHVRAGGAARTSLEELKPLKPTVRLDGATRTSLEELKPLKPTVRLDGAIRTSLEELKPLTTCVGWSTQHTRRRLIINVVCRHLL